MRACVDFGPPSCAVQYRGAAVATVPAHADTEMIVEPASALTGKVAIAVRGKCSFSDKARRSAAAGAVALIVANTDDEPFPPSGEGSIQVVLVGRSDGEQLVADITTAEVDLTIVVPPPVPEGVPPSCG
eukprot:COSAG01_NODE_5035_length_4533_cov_1.888814_2_plen_129_part_00